ncbi:MULTISPECIES: hypothetical protein [Halomonadaceae]|jgi:hypothetical protein|uniref:hypothetical protein n=1 Tax=Halomonadaceae TaxID=28256 RepID=UPI001581C951|nr:MULTISPECIES: hypothetical protein [Halomonas]MDI4638228.1 hypothetical protein [Halomonas sp. BMC7]NUJ59228.1 hypothetical protein [Halomonas taeanensis]
MRDLYQRLGLPHDASDKDIQRAIEACHHSALKADAKVVLGVPEHREAYDALHGTLCDIGLLRARLGLTHGPFWQDSTANDFSLPPDNTGARHDLLIARVERAVGLHDGWRKWRAPWLLAMLLVGATVLGAAAGAALYHYWLA